MPEPTPKRSLQTHTQKLEKTVSNQISKILHLTNKTVHSEMDMVHYIRQGFPFKTVQEICKQLGFTQQELSESLGLNVRTLARRKKEHRLDPRESDRVYRLVGIYALAIVVLENREFALQWLNTPKTALGGEVPFSLLDTEVGVREVERLLGRIEYGVYT